MTGREGERTAKETETAGRRRRRVRLSILGWPRAKTMDTGDRWKTDEDTRSAELAKRKRN